MLVNGKDVHPDELIKNLNLQNNFLKPVNEQISLTSYQISILRQNHINYEVGSLKELIFLINDALNEDDENEELETILHEISERDYYENTKK